MLRLLCSFILLFFSLNIFSVTKSRYEELELFNKVLYLIESQYYRNVDTTKLVEGAIKGMMETLDPHSAFLSKEFYNKMKDSTDGEFGGLGIEVTQKDGIIYVVTPIDDSPAAEAGIKSRDKIVEINHESIVGFTLDEAIEKMKGKEGTSMHLGIIREGEKGLQHYTLTRKKIKVSPVKSFLVDKNYAFIRLTQFQRRSATDILAALQHIATESKKNGGLKGIILDLRSNPGGLLNEAVDVSSIFLKEGIVVSTESRDASNKNIHYVKKSIKKYLDEPLVVLVNGSSASASEIVSGAIQDYGRGIIMGSQTFGKGSVQTVVQIDKNNGVKLTIAQYMTPKGRKIQALGVTPDIVTGQMEDGWKESYYDDSNLMREKDLRNHLTATIESEEEKALRIKEAALAHKKRAELIDSKKKKNSNKKSEEDDIFKKYDPNDDYQVKQAIKHLQAYRFFSKLKGAN